MKPSLTTALLIAGLAVGMAADIAQAAESETSVSIAHVAEPKASVGITRAAESKAGTGITRATGPEASADTTHATEPETSVGIAHVAEPVTSADITPATETEASADITPATETVTSADITPATETEASADITPATEAEASADTPPATKTKISAGITYAAPAPAHISRNAIPVCYDFGCKSRATVSLSQGEWAGVAGWFSPPAETPAAERTQIKKAIGWMETVIGRHTPTHKDLALNLPPNTKGLFPGQLDCIDEATNTTAYLKLFEINGLLKHHTVIDPAYRRSLLNQHWSGQVRENQSGTRYVVDSWFQPNGYSPSVQQSEKWEDLKMLSALMYNGDDGMEKPSFWRRIWSRP